MNKADIRWRERLFVEYKARKVAILATVFFFKKEWKKIASKTFDIYSKYLLSNPIKNKCVSLQP